MPTTRPTFAHDSHRSSLKTARLGLTLIEILIALTMTLIVLGAMMGAFQFASAEMQNGRAVLEMSNRMRVVENLLRSDLANLTVEPRPYIDQVVPNGYFEYVEGPRRDLRQPFASGDGDNPSGSGIDTTIGTPANLSNSYLGDADDILAMTVRSSAGQVFRGRKYVSPTVTDLIESPLAEVVWWTSASDRNGDNQIQYDETIALVRRVLLINPSISVPTATLSYGDAIDWIAQSDVSARIEEVTNTSGAVIGYSLVPNSLQDLADRRNRFARRPVSLTPTTSPNLLPNPVFQFPYPVNRNSLALLSASGSNIQLTDIAAFDVKVFSPDCWVRTDSGVLLEPGDPNYNQEDSDGDGIPDECDGIAGSAPSGAFTDLAHGAGGKFSFLFTSAPTGYSVPTGAQARKSPLCYQFSFEKIDTSQSPALPVQILGLLETVYDTWTPTYESDGFDQDDQDDPTDVAAFRVNPLRPPLSDAIAIATANIPDAGTDGIDNDGVNGVDDFGERETQPPYSDPITGLKVTLRMVEKQTGQVRQSSVEQSY